MENQNYFISSIDQMSKIRLKRRITNFYNPSKNNCSENLLETTFPYFNHLKMVLVKVFLQKSISPDELQLNTNEIDILKVLLIKKNLIKSSNKTLTAPLLNQIMKANIFKKKEYNIKFVLIKAIKHLKKYFFEQELKKTENQNVLNNMFINNNDLTFYQFYFGEISKKKGIPIEKFFAFKNHTHRYNKNIPKTITMNSLRLWKLNPRFISNIRKYLRYQFLNDFEHFNKLKICKMIQGWNKTVNKFGYESSIGSILKSLKAKGSKLPWTLSEVTYAIRMCEEILD
jgi:hypothetical protein